MRERSKRWRRFTDWDHRRTAAEPAAVQPAGRQRYVLLRFIAVARGLQFRRHDVYEKARRRR
jgi:hypothetical protein